MPTLRTLREPSQVGTLAIVALAATILLVAADGRGSESQADDTIGSTWRGLVGAHDANVSVGDRRLVVLKAPSLAKRVARAGGRAGEATERRWTREALASQRELLSRLSLQGVTVDREFTYTRVLNGFSAALDPRAVSLLERAPEVEGVYPVRVGYPAAVAATRAEQSMLSAGREFAPGARLPGFDGRGVLIALLDTGVERTHPYLGGRVRRGADVVDRDSFAAAEPSPDDPAELERHGTEMAGILVGSGGPGGLAGVAPRATLLPIRVAGWQRDASGGWLVYSRTDQWIAGLERAVDPNGDGDAHDGARVVLVSIAEPYAAFADGPSAEAVAGAFVLDSLVVVPAANDGPGGPAYGSLSGPGGAPGALTVGAADLRRRTQEVRVVVRTGLQVLLDRMLPLSGPFVPAQALTLEVGAPRRAAPGAQVSAQAEEQSLSLADFFGRDGLSLVAGRAALVDGGNSPQAAAEHAATAGAYAVVLYGGRLPAGAMGLDEDVVVPVVGIPSDVGRAMKSALRVGRTLSVSVGGAKPEGNPAAGRIAGFSSRGLAFDGRVKPDLAAPGVALRTAEPGISEEGLPRFGTVNGSSAAAATVAGAAALLVQARSGLDAEALKGLLVGTARRLPGDPLTAQGAGVVDVGAATASELAVAPVTFAFDWAAGKGWAERRTVDVRNVSSRAVAVTVRADSPDDDLSVSVRPAKLVLRPRETAHVTLKLRAARNVARGEPLEGRLTLEPLAGMPVSIPWSLVFRTEQPSLVSDVRLSQTTLRPSDSAPAVLSLQAGRVVRSAEVRPVARLDIELWRKGTRLGLLTRLRDLLPGRYFFALTGRGPAGQILGRGKYRLRVVAVPAGSGRTSIRVLDFRIARAPKPT